jgi:hypothetical protein
MLLLLLLLLVGKIAGWLTVITGFAGVVVSALSLQDKLISKASQFLGIAYTCAEEVVFHVSSYLI